MRRICFIIFCNVLFVSYANGQTNIDSIHCKSVFDSASNREVYLYADSMPQFPGGKEALGQFIYKNLRLPKKYIENSSFGKVILSFIVETDGRLTNMKTLKSHDVLLENEAFDVVRKMPAWLPGKCKGETVPVRYTLPINFEIK